ncbi:tetratricopeptide repeat protein [Lutibacter sp. HS1-25]|uniref:tetratricopeptide repeat protein n=1 Tax=Lutibacter sp. HS1-25 TaxID=2485000 RepID=UPI0010111BD2|nr:tetratricopeptide repeat protein [Lutibacter sp. HS1-25]RXP64490.1 tetratricopeptide repeat protein [Lutibacter sp. HS1-25]
MKRNSLIILFLSFTLLLFSQEKDQEKLNREAREDVRSGNEFYNQLKFAEAEVEYKKALSKNPNYAKASYNLGNAIYMQDRNKEAVAQFELIEKMASDKMSKAEAYHNMGNSFMKEKQYDKAVAAYKNSMRNNSKDDETRYNLALAQKLLQDQQNQDNKDDKDNKDNKDNKDDQNKDQKDKDGGDKDKNEDKKDDQDKNEDKQDDKSDQQKNQDQKDKEEQQQQPRPNQLSPEQMKQLLEAMNNEENKTQQKLNEQQTQGVKINQEKDW